MQPFVVFKPELDKAPVRVARDTLQSGNGVRRSSALSARGRSRSPPGEIGFGLLELAQALLPLALKAARNLTARDRKLRRGIRVRPLPRRETLSVVEVEFEILAQD